MPPWFPCAWSSCKVGVFRGVTRGWKQDPSGGLHLPIVSCQRRRPSLLEFWRMWEISPSEWLPREILSDCLG